MIKIIDGRRYDTDKAELVASVSYSNPSDFHYFSEDLYRTRNGNWFIHGEGGAMSKYAVQVEQNSWSGGAEIRPLSEDQAYRWLEEIGEVDAIEKYFSDRVEDA